MTNDDQVVTSLYTGFTLTITSQQTYNTTNSGNPWPAQGTFELVEGNPSVILRDDGVNINISSVDDTSLTLNFSLNEVRGTAAGTDGVTGSFTFFLTKTN